jgi:hypothetical protein
LFQFNLRQLPGISFGNLSDTMDIIMLHNMFNIALDKFIVKSMCMEIIGDLDTQEVGGKL